MKIGFDNGKPLPTSRGRFKFSDFHNGEEADGAAEVAHAVDALVNADEEIFVSWIGFIGRERFSDFEVLGEMHSLIEEASVGLSTYPDREEFLRRLNHMVSLLKQYMAHCLIAIDRDQQT